MVLINPDELHTGSKAHEEGWRYRGFYPDLHRVTEVLDELEIATGGLPTFADSVLHDPEVTRRFLDLHRLLERNASALEQQVAWREAILLLFSRHACIGAPRPAGQEPMPWRWPARCWRRAWHRHPPWRSWLPWWGFRRSISPGCSAGPPGCHPTPG